MVDYEAWEEQDKEEGFKILKHTIEEFLLRRNVSIASLAPELKLKPEDHYTAWRLPGSPEKKEKNPTTSIENLIPHYNKIIIPIDFFTTKQDFEYEYAMPLEAFVDQLENNRDKYLPVLTTPQNKYKGFHFYDKLFDVCNELYGGQYPPFIIPRLSMLQQQLTLIVIAGVSKLPLDKPWLERALSKYPRFDFEYVSEVELSSLLEIDSEGFYQFIGEERGLEKQIKSAIATYLFDLRVYGYDELANFVLDLYKKQQKMRLLWQLLAAYNRYLINPVNWNLGGFINYTIKDLEIMAFLRVFPLTSEDEEMTRCLLLNSPAARSPITLESHKMNVFLSKETDTQTLVKLWEMSEKHKKDTERLAEYKRLVSEGKLADAQSCLYKMKPVYEQINSEIESWKRKEKMAKYSITAGTTVLRGIPAILNNLPPEWKLAISFFADCLARFLGKRIDPKSVVESIFEVKNWPWYEKGIPYFYWKSHEDLK